MIFTIDRVNACNSLKELDVEGAYRDGDEFKIQINEITDVLDIIKEHGQVIIRPDGRIIIYDDYICNQRMV